MPAEEFCCLVVQHSVGCAMHLGLLSVGMLGCMLLRQMQLVSGAVTKLAGLRRVTAVCVCLWLVRKECLEEDAGPAPDTVGPLKDFDRAGQCIPAFQEGLQALVRDFNPPTRSPVRTILRTKLSPDCLLLVEDRDHAYYDPAPWFRAHTVVNAAQRHCKRDRSDAIQTHSYIIHTNTNKNNIDTDKYSNIHTN